MDTMDTSGKDSGGTQKKSPLENLSKEDLIRKCKNLLIIAQKAKQAKDEAGSEIKLLKEQLNAFQSKCDDEAPAKPQLDQLKKQNVSLMNLLDEAKRNEEKLEEMTSSLQVKVDELDTAAESCRRQSKRLTDENDDLIQQLENLERQQQQQTELAEVGHRQKVETLEGDVQGMKEETERLNDETKRKNEQMKELYETFSYQKSELESRLESVSAARDSLAAKLRSLGNVGSPGDLETLRSNIREAAEDNNRLKQVNENLIRELQVLSDNVAVVTNDLALATQRNLELDRRLVASERCREEVVLKLTLEAAVRTEMQQILEKSNAEKTDIAKENVSLKNEKQRLNEELRSVSREWDGLRANVAQVEGCLRNMLEHSDQFLHRSRPGGSLDYTDSSLSQLLSILEGNLVQIYSLPSLDTKVEYFQNCQVPFPNEVTDKHEHLGRFAGNDGLAEGTGHLTKLYTEMECLNAVVSNMEREGELLQAENKRLKGEIDDCTQSSQTKHLTRLLSKGSGEEGLHVVNEYLEQRNSLQCSCKLSTSDVNSEEKEVEKHLENFNTLEKDLLQGKQLLGKDNVSEVICPGEELSCVRKSSADAEGALRDELDRCRKAMAERSQEIDLLKEELSHFLCKQQQTCESDAIVSERMKVAKLYQDKVAENNSLVEEVVKLKACLENVSGNMQELLDLQKDFQEMTDRVNGLSIELNDSKLENVELQTMCGLKQHELNELQVSLSDFQMSEEKNIEEIKSLRLNLETLNKSEDALKVTIQELNQGKEVLTQQVSELQVQLSQNIILLNERSIELNTVNEKYARKETMEIGLAAMNEEKLILLGELSDKCMFLEQRTTEVDTLKGELLRCKTSLGNELEQMAHEVTRLQEELAMNVTVLGDKMSQAEELQCQLQRAEAELEEVRRRNAELLSLAREMEQELPQDEELHLENKSLKERLSEAEKNLDRARQEATSGRARRDRDEADWAECQRVWEDRCEDRVRQLDGLHEEAANLKNMCAEANANLDAANKEMAAMTAVRELTMKKIGEMAKQLSDTRSTMEAKDAELQVCRDELEEAKQGREVLGEKLGGLASQVCELKRCRSEMLVLVRDSLGEVSPQFLREPLNRVQASVSAHVVAVRKENVELLGEMNDMNQALKLRGESISSLQGFVDELEQRVREADTRLASALADLETQTMELGSERARVEAMQQELSELKEGAARTLEASQARVTELEEEAAAFRSRETGDTPSEAMSSSTISRADETARLKDLEDTFEERYTKLRIYAIKLKKRLSDQTVQSAQQEVDKKKLVQEKADLLSKVAQSTSHVRNLQSVQQECDRLQDDLESSRSELKTLRRGAEAAEATGQQLEAATLERDRLLGEMRNLELARQLQEADVKRLQEELEASRQQHQAEGAARRDGEAEVRRLQDRVRATQEQLEATRVEVKKRSVLSLEMQDYEKSVAELTQQLAKERSKISELEGHLETQQDITKGLLEQISLLEGRVVSEEEHAADMKDQLSSLHSRVSELELLNSGQECATMELETQLEWQRGQNESLSLQLADLAADRQKLQDSTRTQHHILTGQLEALEGQMCHLKQSLGEREAQLAELQAEFQGYKVRAHSVLRQKCRPEDVSGFSKEDSLEELVQLRQLNEAMGTRLEDMSCKLQTKTLECSGVTEENIRLMRQTQDLQGALSETRQHNAELLESYRELEAGHREALRTQRLQHDTLLQCYKQQLEQLEERLQSETASLKQQLEALQETLQFRQALNPQPRAGFMPGKTEQESRSEIALLEREDGEGSESVESASGDLTSAKDRRQEPMPLDKLLASTDDDGELLRAREQVTVSEYRIRHLTGLLSEAEQDLAKLTQLNQVLKEEIRRQQRSVEREQHAQNFEYLKNVILKFVTLQSGDERLQLLPVLNTILKLSPEEMNQLYMVASGSPEAQGGNRGWGSYLHLWPSAP